MAAATAASQDGAACVVCQTNSGNTQLGSRCLACWMLIPFREALGQAEPVPVVPSVQEAMVRRLPEDPVPETPVSPVLSVSHATWFKNHEEAKALEDESSPFLAVSVARQGWLCTTCTFRNPPDSAACEMCQAARPSERSQEMGWTCERCTFRNSDPDGERCITCRGWREWVCQKCTLRNSCPASSCAVCGSLWEPRSLLSPKTPVLSPKRRDRGMSFLDSLSHTQFMELARATEDEKRRGADIEYNRECLEKRLLKINATEQEVGDDGSCLFRALSFQIFRTQRFHAHLRALGVEWMQRHPQNFAAFVGEEWVEYVERMTCVATWGDELMLRAICDAARIHIHVITSDSSNWSLRYEPDDALKPLLSLPGGRRHVFLSYLAPVHYNSVTPLEDKEAAALFAKDRAIDRALELRLIDDELTRLEEVQRDPLTSEDTRMRLQKKLERGREEVDAMLFDLGRTHPDTVASLRRRKTFAAVTGSRSAATLPPVATPMTAVPFNRAASPTPPGGAQFAVKSAPPAPIAVPGAKLPSRGPATAPR
eukprot:TRINITY_DN13372_c0_g1_i1.p1 TRINITY_DN13372_c0_g1~~TRINITY_DN13372_c0_g1_i1.p1  ORF type:complete len:571 (+),score=113.05 TRINITY_DN13372_c0_g1_i1:96-1715(+)